MLPPVLCCPAGQRLCTLHVLEEAKQKKQSLKSNSRAQLENLAVLLKSYTSYHSFADSSTEYISVETGGSLQVRHCDGHVVQSTQGPRLGWRGRGQASSPHTQWTYTLRKVVAARVCLLGTQIVYSLAVGVLLGADISIAAVLPL